MSSSILHTIVDKTSGYLNGCHDNFLHRAEVCLIDPAAVLPHVQYLVGGHGAHCVGDLEKMPLVHRQRRLRPVDDLTEWEDISGMQEGGGGRGEGGGGKVGGRRERRGVGGEGREEEGEITIATEGKGGSRQWVS